MCMDDVTIEEHLSDLRLDCYDLVLVKAPLNGIQEVVNQ